MKIYKTILVLFLITFTISLIGCGGGSEKDRVIQVYENTIEFYKSDDFKKNMGDEEYFDKKLKDIIKESGFENEKEYLEVLQKYEDDEDIKALETEMNTVMENILKEEMDKLIDETD